MIRIQSTAAGIHLPDLDIAMDVNAGVSQHVFVTHAHADHVPRDRHLTVYATAPTAAFMRLRGYQGEITELPFLQALVLERAQVTLYPAGHILGSAMIYVESDQGSLLYTGDCRRPAAPSTEGFLSPESVDILITEATFGLPIYRWHAHEVLFDRIRSFAHQGLDAGQTPVFYAYNLGKAQEILHALSPTGLRVQIHGAGYPLCKVYEAHGIALGHYERYNKETLAGAVLIAPLSSDDQPMIARLRNARTAYVSGWASNEARRQQLLVDALIPLSDHIDFYELIDWIRTLRPKQTYITHSPTPEVVCHVLEQHGCPAFPLPTVYTV